MTATEIFIMMLAVMLVGGILLGLGAELMQPDEPRDVQEIKAKAAPTILPQEYWRSGETGTIQIIGSKEIH